MAKKSMVTIQPDPQTEVPLDSMKHALQNPPMAEMRIRQAIAELPAGERENAGGWRIVLEQDHSRSSEQFYVNKEFLGKLVETGVVHTHGQNAGKHVTDLLVSAGLASQWPRRG